MSDIREKLLTVFRIEHKEHLAHIRSLLDALEQGVATVPGPEIDEAFRRAHSLKGAARAVDIPAVETLSHRLEALFVGAREGKLSLNKETLNVIHEVLDATEDVVASVYQNETPPDPAETLSAIDRLLAMESEPPSSMVSSSSFGGQPAQAAGQGVTGKLGAAAAAEKKSETVVLDDGMVRVRSENLDRLLYTSSQYIAETARLKTMERQLSQLRKKVAEVEKAWHGVRKAPLSLLSNRDPELERLRRFCGFFDEQLPIVSSQTRALHSLQQQASRNFGRLGEHLRSDVWQTCITSAESVFGGFQKMVRDLAKDEGKEIRFRTRGLQLQANRAVLQALKEPLMHLLRNAISHGIELPAERVRLGKDPVGSLTLKLQTRAGFLDVTVQDDGRGIDFARVQEVAIQTERLAPQEAAGMSPQELSQFLFEPGFSTSREVTSLAGRGMGLSIVFEQIRNLQGTAEVQSTPEPGTSILLSVPWWALTQHLLLVKCAGQTFGIPFHGIERVLRVKTSALETQEGQPMVRLADGFVPLASLAALLGVEGTSKAKAEGKLHVVILRSRQQRIAALVDDFVTQKEGLVQDVPIPSSDRTKVAGAIVLEDGSVAIVLHPSDLVASFASSAHTASLSYLSAPIEKREPPKILVVDDSITTRSLEKGILEVHGYRVKTAVDGEEALATLRREKVDLVITDVQMPRMDGFQLLEAIRKDSSMASLPVIVVTSVENEEEQKRGLSLGADAYIVKRKFDQRDLLDTIRQIL